MTDEEATAYLEQAAKQRFTELRQDLKEACAETALFYKKILQLEARIKELEAEIKELKP